MDKPFSEFSRLDEKAFKMLPPSFKQGDHLLLLFEAVHSPLFFQGSNENAFNEKKALNYILDHSDDPFDEAFLLGLHKALTGNEEGYRTINVHVEVEGRYYFPPSGPSVSSKMSKLFLQNPLLLEKEASFDGLIEFILRGYSIHPFLDGNGRTLQFALLSLLERIGLKAAPYLPLDALMHGLYYKKTFLYLFHSGGFYYGQKEINPKPFISYVKDLLSLSYDWLIQALEKAEY